MTPPPASAEIDRVLDTNVVAYSITSGLVDAETTDFYRDQLENHAVAVSFQTWAELRVGAVIQGRSLDDLRTAVAGFTIIPYSDQLLDAYVHLRSTAHERNRVGAGRCSAPPTAGSPPLPSCSMFRWSRTIADSLESRVSV